MYARMKKRGRSSFELRGLVIPLLAIIAFTILFFLAGKYFFPEFFSTGFFVYTIQPPGEFKSSETIDSCNYTITASGKYALSGNLNCGVNESGIIVDADNVEIDCLSHEIIGDPSSTATFTYGIKASSQKNITIKNCKIRNFKRGVHFYKVSNSSVISSVFINNNLSSDSIGISLYTNVVNIKIKDVNLTNNPYGIRIKKNCSNINIENASISLSSKGIWINNSANITIKNNNFIDNSKHIFIESYTEDVFIDDCEFNQGGYGVYFKDEQIEKISVKNSQFYNTNYGVFVYYALSNSFINNSLFQNMSTSGIRFESVVGTMVFNNTFNDSDLSISLSENNTVRLNQFINDAAIYISSCYNITLLNNSLQDVSTTAIDIYSIMSRPQLIKIINNSIINVGEKGVDIRDASYITIENNYFNNMSTAISTFNMNFSFIQGNTMNQINEYGIYLGLSHNNQIKSNSITASKYGIYGTGIQWNIFENNNINANKSCINMNSSLWNTIKNNKLQNAFFCILLKGSFRDIINATNTTNCYYGALIHESEDVLVDRAVFKDGVFGILLTNSTLVQITEATINNNDKNGVAFELRSFNNSLLDSNITNNQGHGVKLNFFTHHNTISNNQITNNGGYGIYMDFYATSNTIQYNDLSGNTQGTYYEGDFCTGNTFTGNTP